MRGISKTENPREKHQRRLHSPKVTVRVAITATGFIVVPYFFEDDNGNTPSVNFQCYEEMTNDYLFPDCPQELSTSKQKRNFFQQDGATHVIPLQSP